MAKKKEKTVDLLSKMEAAVHEAGHLVVYAVQGFPVGARIWQWRNYTFSGETVPFGESCLTEAGIAGALAVAMYQTTLDGLDRPSATAVKTAIECWADESHHQLSKEDRQNIADSNGDVEQAALRAYRILRRRWQFVQWSANKLFCDSRLTHPEVEAYLRRYRVKVTTHPHAKRLAGIRKRLLDGEFSCQGMGQPIHYNGLPSHQELVDRSLDILKQHTRLLTTSAKRGRKSDSSCRLPGF